jgi:hypothetical protein
VTRRPPSPAGLTFAALENAANARGLAVRGAFHPAADEFASNLPQQVVAGTLVLLGFTGSLQWSAFAASVEARDGMADPLDRWSRRVVGELARRYAAFDIYPSGNPRWPFQQLAQRCETVRPSPIGLLIHPRWGLWHAYRGGLIFDQRIDLPTSAVAEHPCDGCAAKPCLTSCPVDAFKDGAFDVEACTNHVQSAAGVECRERGCRARRACPIGAEWKYGEEHARFHMDAFLRATSRLR